MNVALEQNDLQRLSKMNQYGTGSPQKCRTLGKGSRSN